MVEMLRPLISYDDQLLFPPIVMFHRTPPDISVAADGPLRTGERGFSTAASAVLLPGFTKPQWVTETLFTLLK